MSNILYLDVRNHDEIDSVKLQTTSAIFYMPSNIIKNNLDFLSTLFEKYDKVYIICRSGSRSKTVKDKYFSNNKKVEVNDVHFESLNDSQVIASKNWHLSLTRKIQIICGTILIAIFCLLYINFNFKYLLLLMGIFMLYVGISGNCFMSSFLTKGDI